MREQTEELEKLTRDILALLQDHDSMIGLGALNVCMATVIHVRFDGAEGALKHSDEATRYAAAQLTHASTSTKLH